MLISCIMRNYVVYKALIIFSSFTRMQYPFTRLADLVCTWRCGILIKDLVMQADYTLKFLLLISFTNHCSLFWCLMFHSCVTATKLIDAMRAGFTVVVLLILTGHWMYGTQSNITFHAPGGKKNWLTVRQFTWLNKQKHRMAPKGKLSPFYSSKTAKKRFYIDFVSFLFK